MSDPACPRCGTPTRGRPFCVNCGTRTGATPPAADDPTPAPPSGQVPIVGARPRRRRAFLSVVTILAILAMGGAAAVVITQLDDGEDSEASAAGGPTPAVLAQVEGVGRVLPGTSALTTEDIAVEKASIEPDELPDGVTAGPGLDVRVRRPFEGRLVLRMALPPAPDDDAVPVSLHQLPDGTLQIEPAIWDQGANEIEIAATTFSIRFPGWANPVRWVEGVGRGAQAIVRGVGGAIDYVADWTTGRTDPPSCRGNPPWWAKVATRELSSVHVCLQSNDDEDGTPRVELNLKSNRNTAQLITLPAGANYVWVEGQPDWLREVLPKSLAGADGGSQVLLLGGKAMSIGFTQPDVSFDPDLRSYRTPTLIILNPILSLLDIVEGTALQASVLATLSCVQQVSGQSFGDLNLFDGPGDGDALRAALVCGLDVLSDPDKLVHGADEVLRRAGIGVVERNRIAAEIRRVPDRLAGTAQKAARAFKGLTRAGVLSQTWDQIFDSLAEGEISLDLEGKNDAGSALSRPADVAAEFARRAARGDDFEDLLSSAESPAATEIRTVAGMVRRLGSPDWSVVASEDPDTDTAELGPGCFRVDNILVSCRLLYLSPEQHGRVVPLEMFLYPRDGTWGVTDLGSPEIDVSDLVAARPGPNCTLEEIVATWEHRAQDCLDPEYFSHLFYPGVVLSTVYASRFLPYVAYVQLKLRELGYSVVVDGKYGEQTAHAVREYQAAEGLNIDGFVAVLTWKSLFGLGPA